MSGSLLIKISVESNHESIEATIRGVLGEISFIHVDRLDSGFLDIVVEKEVANCDEVGSEFVEHERMCDQITRAIHCVAPGTVRYCTAIWLDDSEWFCPASRMNQAARVSSMAPLANVA
jgi:hypothetical protein